MRYLSPWLYYFRFLKTNGRRSGILLPVCSLVTYVTWDIGLSTQTEIISIYQKNMAMAAILDL